MSLILSFVDPVRPARIVGPFDSVRVDGDGIREASGGDVVAQHEERQWKVKGERYSRLDVMSRTRVHFEHNGADAQSLERSYDFGPYERFSAAEGIAYADDQVLAFVSKLGDWFCCDDGRHWAVMVVTGAGWRRQKSVSCTSRTRTHTSRRHEPVAAGQAALPAAREAELHAEYVNGSRSLLRTYGRRHGSRVRGSRLIARSQQTVARAQKLVERALRLPDAGGGCLEPE